MATTETNAEPTEESETYDPTLGANQQRDDLERSCPLCDEDCVMDSGELLCTGCSYTPAVRSHRRSNRDEWENLWEERNALTSRTGPQRKRVVGGFEEAYDLL